MEPSAPRTGYQRCWNIATSTAAASAPACGVSTRLAVDRRRAVGIRPRVRSINGAGLSGDIRPNPARRPRLQRR